MKYLSISIGREDLGTASSPRAVSWPFLHSPWHLKARAIKPIPEVKMQVQSFIGQPCQMPHSWLGAEKKHAVKITQKLCSETCFIGMLYSLNKPRLTLMFVVMRCVYQVVIMIFNSDTIVNNNANKVNAIIRWIKTHPCLAFPWPWNLC